MMTLMDMIERKAPPVPWEEGDNIPWDDPEFSKRMLKEHLAQSHHLASRKREKIEQHVAWIRETVLEQRPVRVLELACGPGLYTSRLAKLGCECAGIDFAPAAVEYATEAAEREGLACTYLLAAEQPGTRRAAIVSARPSLTHSTMWTLVRCRARNAWVPSWTSSP